MPASAPPRWDLLAVVCLLHAVAVVLVLGDGPTTLDAATLTPIQVSLVAPLQPEPPPAPPTPPQPPRQPETIKTRQAVRKAPRPTPPVMPTSTAPTALSAQPDTPEPPAPTAPAEARPAARSEAPPAPSLAPPRFDAAYLNNQTPYPPMARRLRETGTVRLRVRVSAQGLPESIELLSSSGSPRLDEGAREAVRRWRFIPARQGDAPVASHVVVPIIYKLEES